MSSVVPGRARPDPGFHEGELAVQRALGVRAAAAGLEGMLAPASISRGMAGFLAGRTFAGLTARDAQGRLWSSVLVAPAGFLVATSSTSLDVLAPPGPGDPLHGLPEGQPVALIAIDHERRRRFRINGRLVVAGPEGLRVEVTEAFGNCPQYLAPLPVEPRHARSSSGEPIGRVDPVAGLTHDDRATLARATTFVLGTTHPTRGADASHRGGPAGFVRSRVTDLWWPDYPGNNMFTSLGNLQVDPEAAIVVPDVVDGTTLHLHGTAALRLHPLDAESAPDETGRRIVFTPRLKVRTALGAPSPDTSAGRLAP